MTVDTSALEEHQVGQGIGAGGVDGGAGLARAYWPARASTAAAIRWLVSVGGHDPPGHARLVAIGLDDDATSVAGPGGGGFRADGVELAGDLGRPSGELGPGQLAHPLGHDDVFAGDLVDRGLQHQRLERCPQLERQRETGLDHDLGAPTLEVALPGGVERRIELADQPSGPTGAAAPYASRSAGRGRAWRRPARGCRCRPPIGRP